MIDGHTSVPLNSAEALDSLFGLDQSKLEAAVSDLWPPDRLSGGIQVAHRVCGIEVQTDSKEFGDRVCSESVGCR